MPVPCSTAAPMRRWIAALCCWPMLCGVAAFGCVAFQSAGAFAQPRPEAAFVVLGPQGAVARAIFVGAVECPAIGLDGAAQKMNLRAAADARFPVTVCEQLVPPGTRGAAIAGTALPLPRPTLQSMAAFGDTGCRIK